MNIHELFYIQAKNKPKKRLFAPKRAQIDYFKKQTNRDIILKARQLGFTTLEKLSDLNIVLTENNVQCVTIADTKIHADEIFSKVKYAFDNLDEYHRKLYRVDTNSTSKISFGLTNSSIRTTTSARSGTVDRLHVSEFAYMTGLKKEEVLNGSFEAVPSEGRIVVETTANGMEEFYQLWSDAVAGKNEFTPHFYNWAWDPEYQKEPPISDEWKDEYKILAQRYGLISNIQERLQISNAQWYWYYLKARRQRERVKEEYPSIPEEAFLTTGDNVFNLPTLQSITGREPIEILNNGELLIWEQPKPDGKYVIGADTSEGNLNSDYCCAAVIDVETCEQVAELHGRWKDYIFAHKLSLLGQYYNNALIAPERNNHGHSVINSLDRTEGYKNLYEFKDEKYGWVTNAKTKPMMIDGDEGIAKAIENDLIGVNSIPFLGECYSFVYVNSSSSHGMGATKGAYDDRVMAWAIAWAVRQEYYNQVKRRNLMVG